MKCFNCGKEAEHDHHVVPKVKGGIKTIPLCAECHSKVHQSEISKNYLTKLGLLKSNKEILCRIFFLSAIDGLNAFEINIDLHKNGIEYSSEKWVKNQINRMRKINPNDLMNIFEPILQLEKSNHNLFNRDYFINEWILYCT